VTEPTPPPDAEARRPARVELATVVAATAGLVVLYAVFPLDGRGWIFGVLLGVFVLVGLAPMTVWWARQIVRSRRPVQLALEGLLVLLTVLIVGFSATYYAMEEHGPGDFESLNTKIDAFYFTVTTLATVGFGDITALSQRAKVIVSIQMLFDLAFIGVVIRVLSWAVGTHPETKARRG